MIKAESRLADGAAMAAPKDVPGQNAFGITRPHRPAQAPAAKAKPINVAYVRSDDRADMIEIGPHQVASLDALLALRLAPGSIKAAEAVGAA
jgi:hypothetical protein